MPDATHAAERSTGPSAFRRLGVALAAVCLGGCSTPDGSSWRTSWNPVERHYDPYVADPRRARFGISGVDTDSDLVDAGGDRVTLELGGRIDIARFHPSDAPDRGVQLDLDAGFLGDFDRESSLDNLGWSGTYALHLTWLVGRATALRLGFGHESSHLGDEFLVETGRARLNYTRDELRLGVRWSGMDPFKLYAEYGQALHRGNNSIQERGRAQLGAEWSSAAVRAGHPGWYAATDVSAFEESDWDANVALQGGWAVPIPNGRGTWRLGAAAYDGRSAIGELFTEDETRVAVGIWYDL